MTGQAQVPSVSEQSIVPATESRGLLQRALVFAPPTETEQALDDAIPLAVPEDQRPYIERWAAILGDCTNGTWRKHRGECLEGLTIQHNGDFIRAQAKLYGVGVSTIHQKLGILKEINHNPEIPRERKMAEFWRRILPTGQGAAGIHSLPKMTTYGWRRSSTTSIEPSKVLGEARFQPSARRNRGEAARVGPGHLYQKPTLKQCRTLLTKMTWQARR